MLLPSLLVAALSQSGLSTAAFADAYPASSDTRLTFDVTRIPYGAKADGKTNDTKAVQAAIDACDAELGGTIVFPPGRYLIDSVVLSKPNLTLRGDGAVFIKRPESGDHVFKDTAGKAAGLSCYGLKFDLNRSSFKAGQARFRLFPGSHQ